MTRRYDAEHRKISAHLRSQPGAHCAWCATTDDLVADHIIAGKPEYGWRLLCRSCNSKRARGATGPGHAE